MTFTQNVLAPTLSADGATIPLWDAIVIGAGPAGAIAVRELSRRGATTLLVERHSFPREGMRRLLERTGALATRVTTIGACVGVGPGGAD